MKRFLTLIYLLLISSLYSHGQTSQDALSPDFHKERRQALRSKMPDNSVAVFFANPIRNRSNDVDYVYHQDPNFYYLTGYTEPHAVLVVFSEAQTDEDGNNVDEILFVQERNPNAEMWTGYRLGVEGAKTELGFKTVYNGVEFLNDKVDYSKFATILHLPFYNDYRDGRNKADLASLISSFKARINEIQSTIQSNTPLNVELNKQDVQTTKTSIDTKSLSTFMSELREIKTEEEVELIKKAVRISAMGQIEVMKAIHPRMSEREIQGVHEFIYKKYNSEDEGYPSIVGAGSNGCVLHYIENSKLKVENELVLMDLGAEYRGYTADVTRTIPANGRFNKEQAAIYDLVYKAQNAGINQSVVGKSTRDTHLAAKDIINQGLFELGIIDSPSAKHRYFPHATSHHLGLDVHDPSMGGVFRPNMVITVEPGIYIPHGSDCDEKWWGIAVRIEDDILITDKGPVNLSSEAPRSREAIEAMMKEPSVFDQLKLPTLD